MNQQEAFDYCTALGGFLTDIQNPEENALVKTFLETLKVSPDVPNK